MMMMMEMMIGDCRASDRRAAGSRTFHRNQNVTPTTKKNIYVLFCFVFQWEDLLSGYVQIIAFYLTSPGPGEEVPQQGGL